MKSRLSVAFGSLLIVLTALLVAKPAAAQQFSDWSPPTNLNAIVRSDGTLCPAVVNTTSDDQHMTISKDGLTLIFSSNRPGGSGNQDLWFTERASRDECWGDAVNLGNVVNSAVQDLAPNLSTDGHWLYFHSRRPGGCGAGTSGELWVAHRQDKSANLGWETPINLGCTINLVGSDQAGPNHFEDEASGIQFLYFTRKPNTASEDFFDIYVSTCDADIASCNRQGLWSAGEPVSTLNSPADPQHSFGRDTRTATGGATAWRWSCPANARVALDSSISGAPRGQQPLTRTGRRRRTCARSTLRPTTARLRCPGMAPSSTSIRTVPARQAAMTCTSASAAERPASSRTYRHRSTSDSQSTPQTATPTSPSRRMG